MGSFDDTAACEQVLPARDLLVQRALEVRRAGQHEDRIAAVAPVHGERPVQQMPVAIQGAEIRNVPIVAPGLARAVGLPRAELIEVEKREPRPKPRVVLSTSSGGTGASRSDRCCAIPQRLANGFASTLACAGKSPVELEHRQVGEIEPPDVAELAEFDRSSDWRARDPRRVAVE